MRRLTNRNSLTLLAYDSFPDGDGDPVVVALEEFTSETGIDVEIIKSTDTGTMVSSAALTAGNPEADVMWGIDSTFLSRAIDAEIFEPYEAERPRCDPRRPHGPRARFRRHSGRLR